MPRRVVMTSDFWIAVIVVAFLSALCTLIMGIFTIDSGSQTLMTALAVVLIAGPLFLVWLLLVRFVLRPARTGLVTNAFIYGVGVLVVLFGSWQCVERLSDSPAYQEANVGTSVSIPAY